MKTFVVLLTALMYLVTVDPVIAADRPSVVVTFELNEPRLQNAFKPAQRKQVESLAADALAKRLGERIGFMAFSSQPPGAYSLIVRLEATAESTSTLFKETILRAELNMPGAASRSLRWRFRPADRYGDPSGGVEGLVREIDLRTKDIDFSALIRDVLGQVPIAREAQIWKDPVGWVIPYRKVDLCMDFHSVLRIENMLPSGAGPVLKEFKARASADFAPRGPSANAFRGQIFTEPMPAQDGIAELRSARSEDVTIRGVYVVEYMQLAPCTGPVSVDDVEFRGGRR